MELQDARREVERLRQTVLASERKVALLKDQLVHGQTAAEEHESSLVEAAVQRAREDHDAEAAHLQAQNEELKSKLRALHEELRTQNVELDGLRRRNTEAAQLATRLDDSASALAAAEARATQAVAEAARLKATLARKEQELGNLNLAMGDLMYEAESATSAQLACRRAQEEAATATAARHRAEAEAADARARAEASARATEAAEAVAAQATGRMSALEAELSSARHRAADAEHRARALQDTAVDEAARGRAVACLDNLLRGSDSANALIELADILHCTDDQRQMLDAAAQRSAIFRGTLLSRFSRLLPPRTASAAPARPGPPCTSGPQKESIASDWAHFLLDDASMAGKGSDASASGPQGAHGALLQAPKQAPMPPASLPTSVQVAPGLQMPRNGHRLQTSGFAPGTALDSRN